MSRAYLDSYVPTDICTLVDEYIDNGPMFCKMRAHMMSKIDSVQGIDKDHIISFKIQCKLIIDQLMVLLHARIDPTPEAFMSHFWAHFYVTQQFGKSPFRKSIDELGLEHWYTLCLGMDQLFHIYTFGNLTELSHNRIKCPQKNSGNYYDFFLDDETIFALSLKYPIINDYPTKDILLKQLQDPIFRHANVTEIHPFAYVGIDKAHVRLHINLKEYYKRENTI